MFLLKNLALLIAARTSTSCLVCGIVEESVHFMTRPGDKRLAFEELGPECPCLAKCMAMTNHGVSCRKVLSLAGDRLWFFPVASPCAEWARPPCAARDELVKLPRTGVARAGWVDGG